MTMKQSDFRGGCLPALKTPLDHQFKLAQSGQLIVSVPVVGAKNNQVNILPDIKPVNLDSFSWQEQKFGKIPALYPKRAQGNRGTCVAFGSTNALINNRKQTGEANLPLSPEHLYQLCKNGPYNDGLPDAEGTYIVTALKNLKKIGVMPERDWPYNGLPSLKAIFFWMKISANYGISNYATLEPFKELPWQSVIVNLGPIIEGVPVTAGWFTDPGTRVITEKMAHSPVLGRHCQCRVGWVLLNGLRCPIIQGSWKDFGADGFYIIEPGYYEYFGAEEIELWAPYPDKPTKPYKNILK